MVLKFKLVLKFCLVWGVMLAIFMFLSIFQDIRENKLFNYNETYATSEVEVKSEQEPNTTLKYIFKITPHDNYLGSISFNYFRLRDNPGQVIFRIKGATQNDWYAENRYDFSYFNNADNYHFGFPEIADSKNKEYIVEFEIVTPNLSRYPDFLDLKTPPILTAKYVFPRNTFYKFPRILATILVNRSAATIGKMDQVKVVILTFAIVALSFLVFYRQKNQERFPIEIRRKDLQKNIQLNPFWVPAGIMAILFIAFTSGNFPLAERLAVYLWLTLLASAIFYILQIAVMNRLSRLREFVGSISENTIATLDDLMTKKTILLMGILYVIISGLFSTYYLGGDDSRLFYLYPQEFLNNYASKIVSDTGLSQLTNSIPPSSLSAFMIVLISLRKILPIFNLQALLDSANLLGGFFAFYYLASYLLRSRGKHERVICILTSFMYVFSIFNFYTLLNSRLVAVYLISLFPLSLYLGLRAVREGKFYLMVLVAVIWSAFSLVSVTFPLSSAALLTAIPLLVLLCWKYKARLLIYLTSVVAILVVLNIHWLIFIPYSNFATNLPGSSSSSITSVKFRKLNEEGIKIVSEINNSFFPLLDSYHQQIQYNFHWPELPIYRSWYLKFLPLGYVFILVVIWAGISIDKDKSRRSLYIATVASFALAVYFFTVNIGPWGVSVFVWLTNYIPGFVIFRNMYDKFAFGVAFQWATIIAISLSILIKSFNEKNHKVYLLFLVFLIVIINAKPYILGEFARLPYWTTHNSYDGIRAFNNDYIQLLDFVKHQSTTGRYLSLPLLTGNSVIIDDQFQKNHYYAGVSPLLLLAGKNDLSGLISFSDKSNEVYRWIRDEEYTKFGKLLQRLNVKYIIVNNSISTDLQSSFMFSDGLYSLQSKKFIASVLGPKVADFGNRYSLWEISPRFESEKIYIADDPEAFINQRAQLSFTKIASQEYQVEISQLGYTQTLVFLDPYLPGWQLRTPSGKVVFAADHRPVFEYANSWKIDPLDVKSQWSASDYQVNPDGSVKLNLRLYFQPYDYYHPANIISAVAYFLAIGFVIKSCFKPKYICSF